MISRRSYLFGFIVTLALAAALAAPASTAFAQTPVNTVPGAQTLDEDMTLLFSEAHLISVSGVDVGENDLQVTLTAINGTVSLGAAVPPALISTGTGVGDASVTITGTIEEINSVLEGVSFTPALDFAGPASLSITTNDLGLEDPLGVTDVVEIQVLDTTPPVITLFAPLSTLVAAEDPLGTSNSNPDIANLLNVNNGIAVDAVDGSFRLVNDAPPVFPPGTTTVTFTATDAAGNTSTATATVTVLTARTLTVRAIVDLALVKHSILDSAPITDNPPEIVEELDKFIAGIFDSLDFEQWATTGLGDIDQFRLHPGAGDGVFDNPADVVQDIFKAIADGKIQDKALILALLTVVDNLVAADRLLAHVAIADALADTNADQQEIAEALADLDQGDRLIAEALLIANARTAPELIERAGLISDALEKYFEGAWDAAIDSVNSQASSDAESAVAQAASDAEAAAQQTASDAEAAAQQAASDADSAAQQAASDTYSAAQQAASDAEAAAQQAASNAESAAQQAASDADSAAQQAASDADSIAQQAASDSDSAAQQAASDSDSAAQQAASDADSAAQQTASDAASLTSQEASDAASAASQAASDAESAAQQAASDDE